MRHDEAAHTRLRLPPRYGVLWTNPPGTPLIGKKADVTHHPLGLSGECCGKD
jgi:hypothetical protein